MRQFDAGAALRTHAAHRTRRADPRDPATQRCGRPTSRPKRRAGSKTSRNWSARWPSSRRSAASSSTSRWSWTREQAGDDDRLDHDAARRQGPRVRRGVPARLGGRPVPAPARMDESGRAGLEEERRLAYVGITARQAAARASPSRRTAASTASGNRRFRPASSTSCRRSTSRW